MKNTKNKLISMLLLCSMLLSMLPFAAFAEEEVLSQETVETVLSEESGEPAAVEEPPAEEIPAEETPAEATPSEEPSVEATPSAEETPAGEPSVPEEETQPEEGTQIEEEALPDEQPEEIPSEEEEPLTEESAKEEEPSEPEEPEAAEEPEPEEEQEEPEEEAEEPFTVSYYANDGVSDFPYSVTFAAEDAVIIAENAFLFDGYEFVEWNTVAEPTETEPGVVYRPGDAVDPSLFAEHSLTLYAQWKAEEKKLFRLPDDVVLSDAQLAEKANIIDEYYETVGASNASLFSVSEGSSGVIEDEVYFYTESSELAQLVAEAVNGEVEFCAAGMALISLGTYEDGSQIYAEDAVFASADLESNLPALYVSATGRLFGMEDEEESPEYPEDPDTDVNPEPSVSASLMSASYNDPFLSSSSSDYQWHLAAVSAQDAWAVSKGAGITVAVIDSGVYASHEDLSGKVVVQPLLSKLGVGDDYVINSGHGTHVAGVINATVNNGLGGAGVAPEATVYSYNIGVDSDGNLWDMAYVAVAIQSAVDDGCQIINLSLGGVSNVDAVEKAVQYAINNGVTVIAAAGNYGSSTKIYPAANDGVIAVGSRDQDGNVSSFSNVGPWVDVYAPGGKWIYSTYSDGGYAGICGTSQASPVVAGCAALYMSAYGNPGPSAMESYLEASISSSGNVNAATLLGASSDEFALQVSYAQPVSCGADTAFKLTAVGGSGTYKYYLNTVYRYDQDDGCYNYVLQPARTSYEKEGVDTINFKFMASGSYRLYFYAMDMGNTPYQTVRRIVDIVISDEDYPTIEAIADSVAGQCKAACTTGTDYEKALWLHDWILDHCSYDSTYLYCGAEGALVRGTGTCEAYHRAYVMLLSRVGISTGRVEGNYHVWTAVKLDGAWYQVDVTWDDTGYTLSYLDVQHLYFGLTDDLIATDTGGTHTHTPVSGCESNSLEENYFIYSGEIKKYSDEYLDTIQKQIDAGATDFSLTVSNASWQEENYKNIINGLVAYQFSKESFKNAEGEAVLVTASYDSSTQKLVCTATPKNVHPTVYNGVDYSLVYNYTYYVNLYSDIKAAFGEDDAAVLQHFVQYGMSEGRQGNASFDVVSYRKEYADLRRAYGNNTESYYLHYINCGYAEGRHGTGCTELQDAITVYDGTDYALVYDYRFYTETYSDIKAAFGLDDYAVLQHFVTCGITEGRQGSASFDVTSYRKEYADLRRAYGDDTMSYYRHYISWGYNEGRHGTGCTELQEAMTVYNGVDYSKVYDYKYYTEHHSDIKTIFGLDDEAVLEHFVQCGMSEGRQASAKFDVQYYKSLYSDLRDAFGNDLKSYYIHYINCGYKEGRIAAA